MPCSCGVCALTEEELDGLEAIASDIEHYIHLHADSHPELLRKLAAAFLQVREHLAAKEAAEMLVGLGLTPEQEEADRARLIEQIQSTEAGQELLSRVASVVTARMCLKRKDT